MNLADKTIPFEEKKAKFYAEYSTNFPASWEAILDWLIVEKMRHIEPFFLNGIDSIVERINNGERGVLLYNEYSNLLNDIYIYRRGCQNNQ